MKKVFIFLFMLLALTSCDSEKKEEQEDDDIIEYEKGTLENPYTITEALEIIGTNPSYSTDTIYIEGTVSGSAYYNSKYSSYSVYLKDDGTEKTVQVYSATLDSSLSNVKIEEGDKVVASGHYTYYSSKNQPELAGDTKNSGKNANIVNKD